MHSSFLFCRSAARWEVGYILWQAYLGRIDGPAEAFGGSWNWKGHVVSHRQVFGLAYSGKCACDKAIYRGWGCNLEVAEYKATVGEVAERWKRLAVSSASAQQANSKLNTFKTMCLTATGETFRLSDRLGIVEPKSGRGFEVLSAVKRACALVESVVCFFVGYFVKELDTFINRVGTQLQSPLYLSLETAYYDNQLPCSYTLTHLSGVGATSIELRGPFCVMFSIEIWMVQLIYLPMQGGSSSGKGVLWS